MNSGKFDKEDVAKEIKLVGGRKLSGSLIADGSKNACLPIFVATLLTPKEIILKNVPDLRDVQTIARMLEFLGKEVQQIADGTYKIIGDEKLKWEAPVQLVKKMRASFLVLGPLLARLGKARVSLPGGCVIGSRPVDLHLKWLKALGAHIKQSHGFVEAHSNHLKGGDCYLSYPSVGATEHIMIVSSLISDKVTIYNPAFEPEVIDLANFLHKLGVKIKVEPSKIVIRGRKKLNGCEHTVIHDRIVAGTYLIAAGITGGEIELTCHPPHLRSLIEKLEEVGAEIEVSDQKVSLKGTANYKSTQIETRPYPGFPTDLQPQMMSLLACANGESVIKETVFESRFSHVDELNCMGAKIRISGSSAYIEGVSTLTGAPVQVPDTRAGAALVIAGLGAEGTTTVRDTGCHIDRGYNHLVGNLKDLGAIVEEKTIG